MRKYLTFSMRGLLLAVLSQAPVLHATDLVYTPVNPSFGGSALNGSVLLNAAQAQNKHTDPKSGSSGGIGGQQTPLQQFNDILERAVLNRLVTAATTSVMGSDGKLQPGTVNTGNFTIQITDLGGGLLQVTTTDKVTGASTSFQVGGM